MKKRYFLFVALLALTKLCLAIPVGGEATKSSEEIKETGVEKNEPRHPLDSLVSCIIDKHEDVVNNLFERKDWHNPKAIYTLAKQCKATVPNVTKVLDSLNKERQLCPHLDHVSQFVKKKLGQPFENNKLVEGPETFENIDFSMRFFVSGHDPSLTYDHTRSDKFAFSSAVESFVDQQVTMNPQQKEIFHQALGRKKPEYSYFAKDKLHCAYVFRSYPESPTRGIIRENPLIGFLIFDKPVDYHLFGE